MKNEHSKTAKTVVSSIYKLDSSQVFSHVFSQVAGNDPWERFSRMTFFFRSRSSDSRSKMSATPSGSWALAFNWSIPMSSRTLLPFSKRRGYTSASDTRLAKENSVVRLVPLVSSWASNSSLLSLPWPCV